MYIIQIISFPFVFLPDSLHPPLNSLSFSFLLILLILPYLYHIIAMFIEVIRFLYMSSPPSPLTHANLQEIWSFDSFYQYSVGLFFYTLLYWNENCYTVVNLVCLIYFRKYYIFMCMHFPKKCLKFVLCYSQVTLHYVRIPHFSLSNHQFVGIKSACKV